MRRREIQNCMQRGRAGSRPAWVPAGSEGKGRLGRGGEEGEQGNKKRECSALDSTASAGHLFSFSSPSRAFPPPNPLAPHTLALHRKKNTVRRRGRGAENGTTQEQNKWRRAFHSPRASRGPRLGVIFCHILRDKKGKETR